MLKEKQKQNPTKVNEPRLFFFCYLYNPILALFKNGFQMALGAEQCPTQKNKSEGISEFWNFRILGYWIQLHTDTENCRTALASVPPSPTRPSQTAGPAARGPRSRHCLLTAHLLFPPPPKPFLAFTLCQMGVNSSSSFKTLLGGGDSQAPSGTPTVPVTLLYPDPAHTPAGDSRSGLSPP